MTPDAWRWGVTPDDLTRIKEGAARATPGPTNEDDDSTYDVARVEDVDEGEGWAVALHESADPERSGTGRPLHCLRPFGRPRSRRRGGAPAAGDGWDFARQALSGAPAPSRDGRDERKDAP